VRLFLLGSALGALLHQRGLLPLHANAIEMDGKAVAFCGHSGAGKSTIAAWFHDRGGRILTDDVCVIGFDAAGRALAYPGIPRLRLWREALEATGRDAGDYRRSFDAIDKYDVPSDRHALEPLPLAAIYLLRQAEAEGPSIERLQGVDAVETIVSNTYRGAYLKTIGRTGEHLAACLRIARQVPVFRAERLWGFDRFDEQAEALRAHAEARVRDA
jgi:serine kinase of HPr protein (carbohydrate metabolism regulator)